MKGAAREICQYILQRGEPLAMDANDIDVQISLNVAQKMYTARIVIEDDQCLVRRATLTQLIAGACRTVDNFFNNPLVTHAALLRMSFAEHGLDNAAALPYVITETADERYVCKITSRRPSALPHLIVSDPMPTALCARLHALTLLLHDFIAHKRDGLAHDHVDVDAAKDHVLQVQGAKQQAQRASHADAEGDQKKVAEEGRVGGAPAPV